MIRPPRSSFTHSLVLLGAATIFTLLGACSTSKVPPPPTPIVSSNSSSGGFNPNPGTAFNSTQDEGVDIQNRKPESDARKHARLRMELAVGYYQDGKFAVALDELKEALNYDPTFAEAHGVLALVYMELGEKALAEKSFQRALALSPDNSDVNNNYGWFLCQNGRAKESISYFLKAVRNPLYLTPARPLQNAGVCSLRFGDRAAAEEYFRQSFTLDPLGVVSAFNLALIYYSRHELDRARFYTIRVNKTSAANSESLWLGIKIEHALGHSPEELSLSAQLQRAFPNSREAELLSRHAYNE